MSKNARERRATPLASSPRPPPARISDSARRPRERSWNEARRTCGSTRGWRADELDVPGDVRPQALHGSALNQLRAVRVLRAGHHRGRRERALHCPPRPPSLTRKARERKGNPLDRSSSVTKDGSELHRGCAIPKAKIGSLATFRAPRLLDGDPSAATFSFERRFEALTGGSKPRLDRDFRDRPEFAGATRSRVTGFLFARCLAFENRNRNRNHDARLVRCSSLRDATPRSERDARGTSRVSAALARARRPRWRTRERPWRGSLGWPRRRCASTPRVAREKAGTPPSFDVFETAVFVSAS